MNNRNQKYKDTQNKTHWVKSHIMGSHWKYYGAQVYSDASDSGHIE